MNESLASVNHKQIGYRIKEVREQNNFSQAQLAEETELSISYISHIENAKRKASLESIIRIVNALGITVDELLAGVQLHNPTAYQTDLDLLMAECTENEKRFIYEMVKASIDSMHKNGWHISADEAYMLRHTIFTHKKLLWNRLCGYACPYGLFYFLMKIL